MNTPSVTAVIATYRRGDYLRQAIGSALAQSHVNLEVLVTDNADDPGMRRLAESFGDPRVRYRSNPTSLGPAGNHWAAFKDARGRYIGILNDDDLWRPDWLAAAVPVLDRTPEAALVFCDHDIIDPAGHTLSAEADHLTERWGRDELSPGLHRPFADLVARQTIPVAMGCVFRRDAIDLAALPDVGPAYDLWLAFALGRTGLGAYYVKERMTAWRVHQGQITGTRDHNATRGTFACWRAMAADPIFRPVRRTVGRRLADAACAMSATELAAGNHVAARSAARVAIHARPTHWRAWPLLGLGLLPGEVSRRVVARRGYQS